MHDRIYWACADILVLAAQLPSAGALPATAELQQRVVRMLDTMIAKGRSARVPDVDLAEARYALTAFIDEQILKSSWPGRGEWMNQPLQLVLYREYTAGENFFARMRALLQRGSPSPALEIYYLCLALGFRGQYGVRGDLTTLKSFSESARQQLTGVLPAPEKIGPHARPKERARAVRTNHWLIYALMAGCAVLAIAVLGGLSWSLGSAVSSARTQMAEPPAP